MNDDLQGSDGINIGTDKGGESVQKVLGPVCCAITGLADAAADAGFGRVRREFLDGFEREGLNAGLSLQEARYYAFLRATPELDMVEKLATADGLRNGVLNQYHSVPDAGAAQAAQIEEAARAVDVLNDQLLGQIAARRERINP